MDLSLPLDRMTVAEKLRALEAIWTDLTRAGDEVPSPPWHGDVLAAREARLAAETEGVSDWDAARRRLRGSSS